VLSVIKVSSLWVVKSSSYCEKIQIKHVVGINEIYTSYHVQIFERLFICENFHDFKFKLHIQYELQLKNVLRNYIRLTTVSVDDRYDGPGTQIE
jgi:hypothetical protein